MDAFCFNYQNVDCLCTLFKYQFTGTIVVKSGQLFDNEQFISITTIEEWTKCSASRQNDFEDKVQKVFVELLPKNWIGAN